MVIEIFKLFGSILVDSTEAERSIGKVEKGAQGLAGKLGNAIGVAAKVGAAVVAGAGVAAGALYGMANKAAGATDRIDKMSQKIGISRKGFQEWDFILSENGASVDGLQMGLKTLSKAADDASRGVKTQEGNFKRLGVSVKDANGQLKSQEDLFGEVVLALSKMENGTERTALASQLLGRSAQELAPMLNSGAESVEELRQKAHDLGLVLGDDAIDSGVKFSDTMDQLKRSFGSIVTMIGVRVMPIFQRAAEWVIRNMPTIQAVMSKVFGVVQRVVEVAVDVFSRYFLPVITRVASWFQTHMPAIQSTASAAFGKVTEVAREVWGFFQDNILPIFQSVYDAVADKWPQIQAIAETVFGVVGDVVSILWDIFKGLWEFIEPTFPLIGAIVETAFNIVIAVAEGVVAVFETVVGWVQTVIDWFGRFNKTKLEDKNSTITTNHVSNGDAGGDVLGSYEKGTDYVPRTGLYELHRGERVIPEKYNMPDNVRARSEQKQTVHHTFEPLTVRGVNDRGELVAVVESTVGAMLRQGVRRG